MTRKASQAALQSGPAVRAARRNAKKLLALALLPLGIGIADARITRIEITNVESPALGGASFGEVGQFEKLTGTAFGEVDPRDPANSIIQDIRLAPRNARGMVEYSTDLYILKPIDMTKGNRVLFYHVVNRGNGGIPFNLNVPAGNDPATAGDGFLQSLGYTLIKSGWQPDVLPGNARMTMRVPVATQRDGSPITGKVRSELIVATATNTLNLSSGTFTGLTHASYPTVSTDNKTPLEDGFVPTLTMRAHEDEARKPVANTAWAFGACPTGTQVTPSATQICMLGAGFQPGVIYELIYRARDPIVIGLGYAGMRDLISFLKHKRTDDAGTPNPLWLPPDRDDDNDRQAQRGGRGHHGHGHGHGHGNDRDRAGTIALFSGASQSGRNMRTFIHLGFNEDERGRIAFDGAFPLIGGGRAAFNIRFGQPGRAWGHVADHLYPAYEFPFTYGRIHDPLTGETAGILDRCRRNDTCPKIFHFATSLEVWEGRQSLGLTDPLGRRDVRDPSNVRTFLQTSTQHGPAAFPPSFNASLGQCQQQLNPNPYIETQRALWVALTDWVKDGTAPPSSKIPRISDRTLVAPSRVRFPSIPANDYGGVTRPAVKFLALVNPLSVIDYGPRFDALDETGIIRFEPPRAGSRRYKVLVPQVDADGNDIGGIRSIKVLAPTATYTGWNLYSNVFQDDFCTLSGSYIPFAATRAERRATGDPRRSLEERYGTHENYVAAVRRGTQKLMRDRLLLPQDAERLISEAEASDVLR